MLKLKKRGTTWQIIGTLPNGERIRRSTGTDDKELAGRIMAKDFQPMVERAHGLAPRVQSSLTLEEAYQHAWKTHPGWMDAKGKATIHFNWQHVAKLGASRPVAAITQDDVDGWIAQQRASAAPSTVNSRVGVLSVVLKAAAQRGASNALQLGRAKRRPGRIRVVTKDEEQQVLSHFLRHGDLLMADLVVWQVETGLRLGETLALRRANITEGGMAVYVWENKADHPRTVPLTLRAQALLVGGFIPVVLTKDQIEHRWKQARKAVGLEGDTEFVIHALRHTCASRLLQSTGNVELVRQWLGHKDIKTTLGYAHLHPTALFDAARMMSGCVSGVPGSAA